MGPELSTLYSFLVLMAISFLIYFGAYIYASKTLKNKTTFTVDVFMFSNHNEKNKNYGKALWAGRIGILGIALGIYFILSYIWFSS